MTREIKFRAWDGERMWDFFENTRYFISPTSGKVFDTKWGKFLDWKLMQYTGLKDKNGKEIYEGDIVQHTNGWTGVIIWNQDDCAFISESIHDKKETAWLAEDIQEIIGNIYENPELLEKK